jgi:hypothetical protein
MAAAAVVIMGWATLFAGQDTDSRAIPLEHLNKSCKRLPWGVEVWDIEEAVLRVTNGAAVLWVDTRPDTAFRQGSLRDAVPLPFEDRPGAGRKDRLDAAIRARGYSPATVKIAFFCEPETCSHSSYQATFQAVSLWGIDPKNVVWFREGYSPLLKEVRENPLLRRRARYFLDDSAMSRL